MARWDEILTLPVQNPPTLEFSATDIVWSRVEGWRETLDRLALIPFSRVNDFVRGESNNKDCPTKFHVEARRRRSPEMANKPKVDGILEYILYWCSFGPDDHRKGGVIRPSRNYSAKRKTPAGRPNTKRGCVCHFIVKRLIAEPSVALIIYNQDKHVDKKGLPCHGPQDTKAVGTYAMFAPCISDELRLQIMSLLYVGVPVETIMQRHTEAVEKQGGPSNRDDLLTHRYVRRLERKIRRSTYELDDDDIVSISMWVENHRDHVFFYEDFSDSEPFVLGIQTDWQLQQMIQFGNRSIMASDSRFGTNKLKYPVYSLLVFDSKRNAIPVAWIITPSFASSEIHRWMRALYDRIHSKDPTWKLGGVIIDDPLADVNIIREVFQCSILISLWRVRHSWHKNLINKCIDKEMQAEVSGCLGEIVSSICREHASLDSFDDLIEDFIDCSEFLDYFKGVWFPKLGAWANILKALPLASTEISSAIECYHNQLKLRLLNETDLSIYQRADWLVDKLGSKVHSYYWLDEYSGKDNFARYWKDEWKCGLTAWRQALKIPDSDVVFDGNSARVVHRGNSEHVHVVINPGSEFSICDCNWSNMGYLCEHVIKSTKIFRDRSSDRLSTSMFEYKRTLMNVLHCPPHNSLMRDHAISLAISVQAQLSALFRQETCISNRGTSGQAAGEPTITSNQEFDNANEVSKGASLESSQVLQNVGQPYTENFGNAADARAMNGSVEDLMQQTDKSSADLMSAEEQLFVSKANEGDRLDEEPKLLSEVPHLDSWACHLLFARDSSQDDMLVDNNSHEIALHTASAEDVPDDNTGKGETLFSGKLKTTKQSSVECFQSAAEYKAVYGLVNDRCSSHLSDSFNDANGVVDPVVSSHGPACDGIRFTACATIMPEPSPDVSQASVVRFKSADVRVCMDIDVTGSEEKVCDNGANQKRLIVK